MERKTLVQDVAVRHFLMTLLFLFFVTIIQGLGSLFVGPESYAWYLELNKPEWTPPAQSFGPIWVFLYILVALAGFILWTRSKSKERTLGLLFWALQLFFNGMWTFFFFGLKSTSLGLTDLLLALGFTLAAMHYTNKISKLGCYILVPYLLWLCYTAFLNFSIFWIN